MTQAEDSRTDQDPLLDCDDCAAEMLQHLTACDAKDCSICSAGTRADALGALVTQRGPCTHYRVPKPDFDEPLAKLRMQPKRDIRVSNKGRPKNWRCPMCSKAAGVCQCPTCQVCGAKFKAWRSKYTRRTVTDFCNRCARNWGARRTSRTVREQI